jgi:putative cell wall-binding protein
MILDGASVERTMMKMPTQALNVKRLAMMGLVAGLLIIAGLAIVNQAFAATGNTSRVSGDDRYGTAAATAQGRPVGGTVIVAGGEDYPDALAANGLAGTVDAPVLLTESTTLSAATATRLSALAPESVYIVGGPGAVSAVAEDAIEALLPTATVTRLGGTDRYQTAYLIAEEAIANGARADEVLIASGENYPDALSAGPFAAGQKVPILLTESNGLNAHATQFLSAHAAQNAVIVGGTGSVGPTAETALKGLVSGEVIRLAGDDRYATNKVVATTLTQRYGMNQVFSVGVASGEDYPDALAGGAYIGAQGGILIIIPAGDDAAEIAQRVIDAVKGDHAVRITIIGGNGSVAEEVTEDIGATNPKPEWNADFPRTYLGSKGGYIEVKDSVLYICSAGEAADILEIAQWYTEKAKTISWGMPGAASSPEGVGELLDTYDLTCFQGMMGTSIESDRDSWGKIKFIFWTFHNYMEAFGDGRPGINPLDTPPTDPNIFYIFLHTQR